MRSSRVSTSSAVMASGRRKRIEVRPEGSAMSLRPKSSFSIRSRTHRYLRYANGEEELYDHVNDPYEWHNLKDDPAAADVKAALGQELDTQIF